MSKYQATFRYIHDLDECWCEEEPANCDICGQLRPCYGLIQLHEEGYDRYSVCEACLITGRLAEKNLSVNEGDIETLRKQLREQMPEWSEEEREALATERTAEVELRTPRPSVLNLFTWPAHCGDYCVYFQQVDAEDVNRLTPDNEGKTFLVSHLHVDYADVDEEFLQGEWDDQLQGFMRFYLWQCRHCLTYQFTYDSD